MFPLIKILNRVERLPPLPSVVDQVVAITADPGFPMDRLVRAVSLDPGVTAEVLRRLNSAYYGLRHQVSSLEQALPYLGTEALLEIILSSGVSRAYQGEHPGYLLPRGRLWRHCMASAIIAKHLAQRAGYPDPSEAFTAGLLHDVGKLVMSQFVAEQFTRIGQMVLLEGLDPAEAETRVLGIDHATLGADLASRWKLPDGLKAAILLHHRPETDSPHHKLVELVAMADHLSGVVGQPGQPDGMQADLPPRAVVALKLSPQGLRELVETSRQLVAQASDLLDLAP